MPFWMIQTAKNEDYYHFDFGASKWLDIAYIDTIYLLIQYANFVDNLFVFLLREIAAKYLYLYMRPFEEQTDGPMSELGDYDWI